MPTRTVFLDTVALFCAAPCALAGSMSATPIAIDLATAPDFITLPDISMTVGNTLRYQDDVTIFVDGADTVPVSFPLNISCDGYSDYVFGYVNKTQHSWQFRVTIPNELASGTTCTFRDLKIPKSSLVENCSVSVRYEAVIFYVGGILDSGGPITVATCLPPPPVINVALDIRPATMPNNVNLRSRGSLPVAILSEATFYAPSEIAVATLRFGRTGAEASLKRCNPWPEDVNADGLLDLVCHFDTQIAAFQAGDTQGVLKGETIGGVKVTGTDSVRIVP